MKKILMLLGTFLLVIGLMGNANAITTFFNFEDGTNNNGVLSGLNNYLDTTFGSNVTSSDLQWYGESSLFGSDVLYLGADNDGTLDFDSLAASASNFEITSVSFTWGVYDAWPSGVDFGLDVYDDTFGWRNNVFTQTLTWPWDQATGSSGLITFNSGWEVTQLRIHDSGEFDVGLDNLTVYDNRASVPEPATMLLLGMGLLGMGFAGRRRFKK